MNIKSVITVYCDKNIQWLKGSAYFLIINKLKTTSKIINLSLLNCIIKLAILICKNCLECTVLLLVVI